MLLEGKTAVITGANRGIGAGLALEFGREGARVVVNHPFPPDRGEAEAVVARIREAGGEAIAVEADLRDAAARERLIEAAAARYGGLDILINNAGFDPGPTPFLEASESVYDHILGVNLKGTFFVSQLAARHMVEQGRGGRIVHISSVHAAATLAGRGPYAASKGGIEALTRSMALDLAPHRITVNAIAPGFIEVERTIQGRPGYTREEFARRIPVHRVGFPLDVARLAVFLSTEGADYLTGAVIPLDGGLLTRLAL